MRLLPFLLFCFAAAGCRAAEIPKYDFKTPFRDGMIAVGMECHKKNRTLEIGLFYQPPAKRMDLWLTADLVHYDSTMAVTEILDLERQCTIGDDRYKVRFRGVPGAMNGNWMCGAVVTAEAKVWKNGRVIFDKELDRCSGGNQIRTVRFRQGSDEPEIEHHDHSDATSSF